MNPHHPDPCASSGETSDALRRIATRVEEIRVDVERILTGAYDGACDTHQVLVADTLRRELLAAAAMLGMVETAKAHALSRVVILAREVA